MNAALTTGGTMDATSVAPAVLLADHLKALKLPTFAREYDKVAAIAAQDRADYATAASPTPITPLPRSRLFVCNDWPLFKPGNGPFLYRALQLSKSATILCDHRF